MELSTILSIASIIMTGAGMIWIGGFRLSGIIHDINTLKVNGERLETRMEKGFEKIDLRFEKLERKLESLQTEFHKHDIRITTLEQHKP